MRIIISEENTPTADAIVTRSQLIEIIDLLKAWGASMEHIAIENNSKKKEVKT